MPAACSRRGRLARSARRACPSPSRRGSAASRTRRRSRRSRSRRAQRGDLAVAQQQVGAAEALEGHDRALRARTRSAKRAQPARLQPEDVVGEPDVVGRVRSLEPRRARRRRSPGCARCSAGPRSAWRTSCSGTGSRASSPGSSRSGRAGSTPAPVALDVDQVPGRERQRVEVLQVSGRRPVVTTAPPASAERPDRGPPAESSAGARSDAARAARTASPRPRRASDEVGAVVEVLARRGRWRRCRRR